MRTAAQVHADALERQRDLKRAKARQEENRRLAHSSSAHFVEYALRDEGSGKRLHNASFHFEWHEFIRDNPMIVLIAPVEHAKSQQIGVGKTLHMLGNNPNLRGALISNTATMAEKLLGQIRISIERNPRVREVFPNLRPSSRPEDPWRQDRITVERTTVAKDPTLQAIGAYGPLVGSRLDFIVLDDVLDFDNARTEEQRKKLVEWFDTTVLTRLVKNGKIFVIGTPWHPDDLLHVLAARPGFKSKRYSAVHNPDDPPERWQPIWPEQWDHARLNERRLNTTDHTFARKYLCRVRLDGISRFKQIWLQRMCQLGMGRTFLADAPKQYVRGPKMPCFTGVDLGVGDQEGNALTVLFTIALMPDKRRLIVDIEAGRWQAPEIIDRLESVYRRYDSTIWVESNAAQKFLVQMTNGRVPVTGFNTGSNKWDESAGVESLAVEMRNGLWLMPSGVNGLTIPAEGVAFINECLYFDPSQHTGDRLMAAWFAREAARKYGAPRTQRRDTQHR